MSELTGNGKMSDFDNNAYVLILISISPVLKLLLIVSSDLFTTFPCTLITLSFVILLISLNNSF